MPSNFTTSIPRDWYRNNPNNIDPVSLVIGGVDVTNNIQSYSISYDMFGEAGSFTCDLFSDKPSGVSINLSKKETFFRWTINGIPWMNGYIDKITVNYSKNGVTQTVQGRDLMQILTDNTILYPKTLPDPLLLSSLQSIAHAGSLQSILSDVWLQNSTISQIKNMYGGKNNPIRTLQTPLTIRKYLNNTPFIFSASAQNVLKRIPQFKKITEGVSQPIFDFVSNLCNQVGLILYNPPGTNYILVHSPVYVGKDKKSSIMEFDPWGRNGEMREFFISNQVDRFANNNVISCSYTEDVTGYAKYLKVIGSAADEDTIQKELSTTGTSKNALVIEKIENVDDIDPNSGAPITGPVTPQELSQGYSGITKLKSINVDAVDVNTWAKTRDLLMNNALLTQNRELYKIRYTVSNHSPQGGIPYFFGQVATVTDDFLNFKQAEFMVYSVNYTGSKDQGLKTELELASPISLITGRNII